MPNNPLLLAFFIIFMGVTTVMYIKQVSRGKRGEDQIADAITRARKRFGIKRPGLRADGVEVVEPSVYFKAFSLLVVFAAICAFGSFIYIWRDTPEMWLGKGLFFVVCALPVLLLACHALGSRLEIADDALTFRTAFRTRRLARADIRGYVWHLHNYKFYSPLSSPYMEQVIFDKLGAAYVIPNVLKDRIPRDSWLWDLEDLGQGRSRWWPW
jgi:hypothetical protein